MNVASDFWQHISQFQTHVRSGDVAACRISLNAAAASRSGDDEIDENRRQLLRSIAHGTEFSEMVEAEIAAKATPTPQPIQSPTAHYATVAGSPYTLGRISPEGEDGISLVACAMNRTENLLKAMESWVCSDQISEIVIVDWCSDVSVRDALDAAGVDDPRIRIVRVDAEPRWILSYAFNAGFRVARFNRVLKVDADIVLGAEFFVQNALRPGQFIAGNWRNALEGQAHVNGFFFAHKSDIAAVGGFNEFITTYGWDDDDIYERLVRHGVERADVVRDSIYHLPHSDEDRLGGPVGDAIDSAATTLTKGTMYRIRRNRFLANVMPHWSSARTPLPLKGVVTSTGDIVVRRTGKTPNSVPAHVDADADYYALVELASWKLGPRVWQLDRDALALLLDLPLGEISPLDISLAMTGKAPSRAGYVLIDLPDGKVTPQTRDALRALAAQAGARRILLRQKGDAQGQTPEGFDRIAAHAETGPLTQPQTPEEIAQPAPSDRCLHLALTPELIARLHKAQAAPNIATGKPRLFIDAQHGLGNRLRAIGSAAAVARQSERELVIVWEPDHHCEGRLSDLYTYDGAVIEEAFATEAADQGARVYNYMEIEDGAQKDAPVDMTGSESIYVRSAYVLNSPLSDWAAENRFLRGLNPVEAVRDLVARVRTPNDLSAHVRMVGGTDFEHLTYESLDNWTEEGHAQTEFWRKKSHFSHFIARIDTLIAEGRADRLFLAADKPETYDAFTATFGERVAYLPRELYDRSAEQLQYALADALLLGSAPLLLGSTWSSFSELAMRLSHQEMKIEMSGKDF